MANIPLGPILQEPQPAITGLVPFALGFRPFFLLAGFSAVIQLVIWLVMWRGALPANDYWGSIGWHSHEMLFGYSTAVVAGFLLTAVRNWTGMDTPTGPKLALIAAIWLGGRLVSTLPGIPAVVIAVVDLSFFPVLLLALFRPLVAGKNHTNRLFLPLLLTMFLANLLTHLDALGMAQTADRGVDLMLNMILLLMAFVGGRVMPFFTESAIQGADVRTNLRLEQLGFAALIGLALVELVYPNRLPVGIMAVAVTLTQGLRLAGWYDRRVWEIPLLWILFTGFGWYVVGFLLKSAAAFGILTPNLATHALTMGAVGVVTLGMMARVALGHSGRALVTVRATNVAFVLLNLGVVIRVFLPMLAPSLYARWIDLAGALWLASFVLFAVVYTPVLLKPRIDGRPG